MVELILVAASSGALLASWFAWSVVRFGWRATLFTNTAVTDSSDLSVLENAQKIAFNLVCTTIPHVVWLPLDHLTKRIGSPTMSAAIRDKLFVLYQQNLPFAFGIAGMVLMPMLIWFGWSAAFKKGNGAVRSSLRQGWTARGEAFFWAFMAVSTYILGIAVHGSFDELGLLHICLSPLVMMGVVWMAAAVPTWSKIWRFVLVAGWQIDFALGIVLQLYHESSVYRITQWSGGYRAQFLSGELVSREALKNILLRGRHNLTFLGELVGDYGPVLLIFVVAAGEMWVLYALLRMVSSLRVKETSRAPARKWARGTARRAAHG